MRAATVLAVIAPVAFAANSTVVAPSCTTVPVPTSRPTGPAPLPGSGNGTVNGTPRPTATIIPHPTSSIVTAGANQQVVSLALMGVIAAGAAFIL